ncbi:MAG: DUF2723 domain-containing protein [Bacteroidetes bacterium]|nr:DUF2723 domain-containing protein [Bacteroidota bacterium]
MEKKYSLYNTLLGWIVFAGASIVYMLTKEPSMSLWDCGEFLATSASLQVGHPPGAPLYLMLGRIAALFASTPETIAYCINSLSALASGATIMFLFWSITHFAKKLCAAKELSTNSTIVILLAGLIGSTAYAFTDTFWFSAVEAEVYALSSLFTAVVFWAILKWEAVADKPRSNKWILLIAYIMGLSVGVHLLNILTICAIVFVIYFKKYTFTPKSFILAGVASLLIIVGTLWGIIPGTVTIASKFELFFINVLGMPYDTGFALYLILLAAAIVTGIIITRRNFSTIVQVVVTSVVAILAGMPFVSSSVFIVILFMAIMIAVFYYVAKRNKTILNTIINCIALLIIGYSSYAMIYLRSNAEPPLNENAPNDPFAFLSYLNRDQYGSTPLLYGEYYNAVPQWGKDGRAIVNEKFTYTPRVVDGKDRYVRVSAGVEYKFQSDFCTIFPRMHSRDQSHIREYKTWAGIKDGINTRAVYARDANGRQYGEKQEVPTFGQNLRFFFSYQIGHMYVRYFMWNFAGRQNDVQSHGGIINGNWITGIPFIDNALVGDQTYISEKAKNDTTRCTYFLMPFALGLIGFFYQFAKNKKDTFVVMLLFLLTGLAIVVYLNQTPLQPRERDYAYAGSFYAFAIWIGLAVVALYDWLKRYVKIPAAAIAMALLLTVPTPIVLAVQNWAAHDRSGRYTARDFAYNYLATCSPHSMIVSAGDNDTFPMWYMQEVEGGRNDVRVLCSPLLATDWYSQQIMRRAWNSAPLPTTLTHDQVAKGIRDAVRVITPPYYVEDREGRARPMIFKNMSADRLVEIMRPYVKGQFIDLHAAMEVMRADNIKVELYGEEYNFIPARKLFFTVDKEAVLANNIVAAGDSAKIVSEIRFEIKEDMIYKNKLMIYDILDGYKWDRPLYFSNIMSAAELGLEKYLRYDGFAYKFVPIESDPRVSYADTDVLYNNIMNVYQWRGLGEEGIHIDHFHNRTLRVVGVREMFNQLAVRLAQEGKKDKAVEVLDKLRTLLPDWQVPYFDENIIMTARAYYMCGEPEKANDELYTYFVNLCDEVVWFNSLSDSFRKSVDSEKQNYLSLMVYIAETAQMNRQTEFMKKLEHTWLRTGYPYSLAQTLEREAP